MRITLVGPPGDRRRIRDALANGSLQVVDEADSVADARRRGVRADAVLLTGPGVTADRTDADRLAEPLTAREIDVLGLLAEGLPNKQIATRLHISDQTVKFHVASICGKLGALNRTDAVRLAIRRGLVTI